MGDSRPHRNADEGRAGVGTRSISLREKELPATPIEGEERPGTLMGAPRPSFPPGRPTLIPEGPSEQCYTRLETTACVKPVTDTEKDVEWRTVLRSMS